MHTTQGTRPAFESLSHEELALSVGGGGGGRDQNILAGSKLERKLHSERHLRKCKSERDNNICFVKEKEREKGQILGVNKIAGQMY
jgi:hypothetical protein